ncbi:MgtC/SapB family protein (plasmid) [Sphingomonas naphthae]|uniref:Protein MgtC n=1 Tax=Sphingomonas naphthae TaxID=1813468 RepID=A0ABY7TTF6_9SPHN|nr:MgtC/SapB family protein [Sphingomonas naphthae]WCT75670.1 MgtC/SapB family protein [Sphingomonas naphthae]
MIEASAASDIAFWIDAISRLVVATAAGMVLGWERSRENRQIMGLRTLGLVGLASCIAVQAIVHSGLPNVNADAAGRAMQGILSGVGFIGAGAVLRVGQGQEVHGLATAACIWVTATIGAAAGLAVWPLIIGGVSLAMLVLFVGAPLERRIRERARLTPTGRMSSASRDPAGPPGACQRREAARCNQDTNAASAWRRTSSAIGCNSAAGRSPTTL